MKGCFRASSRLILLAGLFCSNLLIKSMIS